jgi:hypothetical protein
MQIKKVQFENAQIGEIYVTRGGLLQDVNGRQHTWGYERVKLLEKDMERRRYVFETPWGTRLEVSGEYEIFTTPETVVRSAHRMTGLHDAATIEYIPFDQAIDRGICTIVKETSPNDISSTESLTDIKRALIEYFKQPREIAAAARHFQIQYPRIRSLIKTIVNSGVENLQYVAIEGVSIEGKKTIQLKEKRKNHV